MSVLSEIKNYLDSLGTLGLIKIGSMPVSPDVIGVLYEYGGRPPEQRFGIAGIGYEHPAIQLVFRGIAYDYNGPRDKAEIAWRALAAIQPGATVSGSTIYLDIKPQQSPFPIDVPDDNNRKRIGCNFYAMKEPSAS